MDIKTKLRENIFKILEEQTMFQPGDTVSSPKDGDGVVVLSKHPYYSVKSDSTGVTNSYHFDELQETEPIESEFGKYDIDNKEDGNEESLEDELDKLEESSSDKIIKFQGILTIHEGEYLTDILSDIRSLQGVTIVKNEDLLNHDFKTKLKLKIDPYSFGDQGEQKIISLLIKQIKQIPGVRDFQKIKNSEKTDQQLPTTPKPPTPVRSIEDLLKENKIRLKK